MVLVKRYADTGLDSSKVDVDRTETVWCAAKRRKTTRYTDSVATLCGGYIIMPIGLELGGRNSVTCPDCRKKLRSK